MNASLLTIVLLGILEGLTEFLPVSSTGHLILAGELLGFRGEGSVAFKIAIQLGAIGAVVVAYWRRFWDVGTGLLKRDAGAWAFSRNIALGFAPALAIGVVAYFTGALVAHGRVRDRAVGPAAGFLVVAVAALVLRLLTR